MHTQPTWSCGIFDLTAYWQHPLLTVLSNAFVWEETKTALISAGSLNVMTHLDQNMTALLHWHTFKSFDTSTYHFQERKKGKNINCFLILWFWIMKELHQCCLAAVFTFQNVVNHLMSFLHNLQEKEKQSSWKLVFSFLKLFAKADMNVLDAILRQIIFVPQHSLFCLQVLHVNPRLLERLISAVTLNMGEELTETICSYKTELRRHHLKLTKYSVLILERPF